MLIYDPHIAHFVVKVLIHSTNIISDEPMKRPKRFEIEFDAPGNVYFSEQAVTGKIILDVTEPIRLKGKLNYIF